jgi:Tfp pilus assembly protein PilN
MALKRINLLPPEERVKASRERGLMYAVVALVAVVVALGAVYFWQHGQVSDKQAQVDSLEQQIAQVNTEVAALQPYQELQTKRTSMTTTARAIYDARVPWSTILEEISLVIPDNVRLTSLTCAIPATMLPGAATAAGGAASATDITFVGQTYEHQDVADFMTRLGLLPHITNIQLSSSTQATSTEAGAQTLTTFTVTASLRPYLAAPPTTTTTGGAQ